MSKPVKKTDAKLEVNPRAPKTTTWVDEVPASTRINSPLAVLAAEVKANEGKVAAIQYSSQRSASASARSLRNRHGLYATTRGNMLYVSTSEEAAATRPIREK